MKCRVKVVLKMFRWITVWSFILANKHLRTLETGRMVPLRRAVESAFSGVLPSGFLKYVTTYEFDLWSQ